MMSELFFSIFSLNIVFTASSVVTAITSWILQINF